MLDPWRLLVIRWNGAARGVILRSISSGYRPLTEFACRQAKDTAVIKIPEKIITSGYFEYILAALDNGLIRTT